MKAFILLILMIDSHGNEHLDRVNNINYTDKLHCLVDKAVMSKSSMIPNDDERTQSIHYFCTDKKLFKEV